MLNFQTGKHLPIIKLLVENGANPNAQTKFGNTPFLYAVKNNREKIVELFFEHGQISEQARIIALNNAKKKGHKKMETILEKYRGNNQ